MKNPYIKLIVRLSVVCFVLLLLCKVNDSDTTVIAGETAGILVSEEKLSNIGSLLKKEEAVQVLTPVEKEEKTASGKTAEDKDERPELVVQEPEVPISEAKDSGTLEELLQTAADENTTVQTAENSTSENQDAAEAEADVASSDNSNGGEDISDGQDGNGDSDNTQNEAAPDENEQNEAGNSSVQNIEEQPEEETDPEETVPDESLFAGLSELEAAELRASFDGNYKSTAEYIGALLVTDINHFDASVVAEALNIPTESNDARYEFITDRGYKAYTTTDMPAGFKNSAEAAGQMVTFDVPVWKMNSSGKKYSSVWSITIHKRLEASVRCIFSDIYMLDIKFPFNYLKGFMYRKVGGSGLMASKLMSAHAFGVAMDINYWDEDNDYYLGYGNDLRDKSNPYCIPDEVIDIFAKYGWYWGGNFDICADTMHFQYFGLDFLQYDSDEPFPILSIRESKMNEQYVLNLTQRLVRLGYLESEGVNFDPEVDRAVRAFQEDYGLEPDGVVNYSTWEPLINATHDMSYVF